MQAVVKSGPEPGVQVRDVAEPAAGPGEVLLKVESASVCGTDLDMVKWAPSASLWNSTFPLTMGHEYCGEIIEVGDGVEGLEKGQRVVGESHAFCGTCPACKADRRHNCFNMKIPGVSCDGAFAPLAVVPANACFVMNTNLGPEACLYEPAGVAVHATQQAGDIRGRTVAITGAGPVGLFLVAALMAQGAAHVAVMEPTSARRSRAESLGARGFRLDQDNDLVEFCREHGQLGGADIAFDVSGSATAYATLFDALGKEGTLVSVGHASDPVAVNIAKDVNLRVINWRGVFGRRIWSTWALLDDLVNRGLIDLSTFVEAEVSLDQLPKRIEEISQLPGKALVFPN